MLLVGLLSFMLQPAPPDPECAAPGEPTSGFVAEDDPDCAITIESYQEIREYESSPKPFRIAGALLVLGGLGLGVFGIVSRPRSRDAAPPGVDG